MKDPLDDGEDQPRHQEKWKLWLVCRSHSVGYHLSKLLRKWKLFREKRLDLSKDGVSLPGLVLKYLMKGAESDFYLFDEEDKITKEDRKTKTYFIG